MYFEAFTHFLHAIQSFAVHQIPFQRYLVDVNTAIKPPDYLARSMKNCRMNFTSLVDTKTSFFMEKSMINNVLVKSDWPGAEAMGMDETQHEALFLAMTKELAIIQGPAGTGKTFIGLKIVEALLANSFAWSTNPPEISCPQDYRFHRDADVLDYYRQCPIGNTIVVVSYTNHALDQFLEGTKQCFNNRYS